MENKYYSEGKYKCNHPESDFKNTSTNPIEMKPESFIEYTHRNETANYRYDVWNNSSNVSTNKLYGNQSENNMASREVYNRYSTPNYRNVNNTTGKKKNNFSILIFIILIYFLPAIFVFITTILGLIFGDN